MTTIAISPTYRPDGSQSGKFAVVLDIDEFRYHYQPNGLVSYPLDTAEFFATDLHQRFAGADDPLDIMADSDFDFKRVA